MRFVDTNVFIYIFVKSPQKDYEIARSILHRIQNGEEAATSLAVIQEAIDWLEYNNRKVEVRDFLTALNSYLSMDKLTIEWDNFLPSIEDMYGKQVDFVDALSLQIMKQNTITEIYSNDKDFDRVNWVKRIWE
ncbi:MAG TPA: type II toxin-antitoxin system VapC family toxin [Verrucomicrobiae bacterium]|nr:type II toxin-antitoxin system VapC family toxin [Verrucomicrobiae bacterium]